MLSSSSIVAMAGSSAAVAHGSGMLLTRACMFPVVWAVGMVVAVQQRKLRTQGRTLASAACWVTLPAVCGPHFVPDALPSYGQEPQ
jgi:hypothetical protein